MILYITFSGKDTVQIHELDLPMNGTYEIAQYNFTEQKDSGFSFLQLFMIALEANSIDPVSVMGIIVQWGQESRFTVSRLTGVTLNTFAFTYKIPITVHKPEESLERALERLKKTTTTFIPIEYSAEPRLG